MNATGDPAFSMFNLSLKEEWTNNRKFCHRLSDDEDEEQNHLDAIQEAKNRLAATMSTQCTPRSSHPATPNVDKSKSPTLPRREIPVSTASKIIAVQ